MNKKILVIYFSASGTTRKVASMLAKVTNADLFEIEPEEPYTKADLDWMDKKSRSTLEMSDPSSRPKIKNHFKNMNEYDIVFLGFPIWWYTAPTIIKTFLESYDFINKRIILFATSGGSGLGKTENDLKPCAPNAIFEGGKVINGTNESMLKSWIESLKI